MVAVLHDIGIPESIKKYNSSQGKYQEIKGPPIAGELLKGYNLPNEIKKRVCYLIGNHHSYNNIDDINFQILIEADFLVNIYDKLRGRAVKKMKKLIIIIRDYRTIILIVCILLLYLIYIKPVELYTIINSGEIRSVFVSVIFNDVQDEVNKVPNEYRIRLKKEDFDEYVKILNRYKYSKIPIYYHDMLRPDKYSDMIVDCTINYNDENILHQQVTVYSDNEVRFYNKKGAYRNYSVQGNKNLFEELLIFMEARQLHN